MDGTDGKELLMSKKRKRKAELSVTDQISLIKAEICEKYCMYPDLYRDEIVLEQQCRECVLNKL